MIELSADYIAAMLPATRSGMDVVAARYNEITQYGWDRVIEFLKLHYVLSERNDTAFWRAHRDPASIRQRLIDQRQVWRCNAPSEIDMSSSPGMCQAEGYQYALFGWGWIGRAPCRVGGRRAKEI